MVGDICHEHGKPCASKCTWCAKRICLDCEEAASGYKLCDVCAAKLAKDKPLIPRRKTRNVRNVDETLTEDSIKEAQEQLFEEERGPKIRNVPDEWPIVD